MKTIPNGTRVKILSCEHADVRPGTEGIVTERKELGYCVEVTGTWLHSGAQQSRKQGTETVWCAKVKEL